MAHAAGVVVLWGTAVEADMSTPKIITIFPPLFVSSFFSIYFWDECVCVRASYAFEGFVFREVKVAFDLFKRRGRGGGWCFFRCMYIMVIPLCSLFGLMV